MSNRSYSEEYHQQINHIHLRTFIHMENIVFTESCHIAREIPALDGKVSFERKTYGDILASNPIIYLSRRSNRQSYFVSYWVIVVKLIKTHYTSNVNLLLLLVYKIKYNIYDYFCAKQSTFEASDICSKPWVVHGISNDVIVIKLYRDCIYQCHEGRCIYQISFRHNYTPTEKIHVSISINVPWEKSQNTGRLIVMGNVDCCFNSLRSSDVYMRQ